METPKLLWLKENRPDIYHAAGHFFDLTDFLTWKASGTTERSACTVTCKWTYLAHEGRWDPEYFHGIGLGDLARDEEGVCQQMSSTLTFTAVSAFFYPEEAED